MRYRYRCPIPRRAYPAGSMHAAAAAGHGFALRGLMRGARGSALAVSRGLEGATPLHAAVAGGQLEAVSVLLDAYEVLPSIAGTIALSALLYYTIAGTIALSALGGV